MKYLKSIFKKIFFLKTNSTELEKLIQKGSLVVGKNSDISRLNIHLQFQSSEKIKISIGDDCLLYGSISIYSETGEVLIGNGVFIGPDTKLFCRNKISIGDNTMISWGCTLIDTNAHSLHSKERLSDVKDWKKGHEYKNWNVVQSSPINIKSSCWIGFNSIVTKGVTMEEGSILGCGSVLTKNVNPFEIFAGNPAVYIKTTD